MRLGAEARVPTQREASEPCRLAIADEQAERKRVGQRDDLELGCGRPG
jgi:hypothetical protein